MAISYQREPGSKEAKGCTRGVFSLEVDRKSYDLFFNSAGGYRAHFRKSPAAGLEMNRRIIDSLSERLLDHASEASGGSGLDVSVSLRCGSAKIWIDEKAADCTLSSSMQAESVISIEVPHWVKAAREAEVEQRKRQRTIPAEKNVALWGVQAPEGTTLKVFGAWIRNGSKVEFIAPSKRRRHQHIWLYGFS
jgi:hypothetical protein